MSSHEPKFLDFECPYCISEFSYPRTRLGTAQECPHCAKTVVLAVDGSKKASKLRLPIATARLQLRPLKLEDFPDWLEFITDEDSYQYLDYSAPDEDEARAMLEKDIRTVLTHPGGFLALGIEEKSDAKLIGYLLFYFTDPQENRQGMLDITVNSAYRKNGYGVEAVTAVFEMAFEEIGLHDIRISIDSRNEACEKMLLRAGMRLEGQFEEDRKIRGVWVSTKFYGILASQWRPKLAQ